MIDCLSKIRGINGFLGIQNITYKRGMATVELKHPDCETGTNALKLVLSGYDRSWR